jgi:hypothetical protein
MLCVDRHELRAALNDLDPLDLRLHPEHPRLAPAAAYPAIRELRSRLERDECQPTGDQRRVALDEPRSRDPIRAEDVRVDDDRPAGPDRAHDSMAARKAASSSSLRSSITISSCGGSGRARLSSSSTGSPDAVRRSRSRRRQDPLIACSCSSPDNAPRSEESKSYRCEKRRGLPSADAVTVGRLLMVASGGSRSHCPDLGT